MVTWLQSLLRTSPDTQPAPDSLPSPWASGRTAILERINALAMAADGSLVEPGVELSDLQARPAGFPVAAGAGDQDTSYEPSALERPLLEHAAAAIGVAADNYTAAKSAVLYHALLAMPAAGSAYVLAQLPQDRAASAKIANLARWLAQQAPDIIPVKMAIALLGRYGSTNDADLIMTLGRHEEFTLTCADALCALLGPEAAQTAMWNLARRVHGWGRIHVVRRLASTGCPEIQQWLLRDGYKNARMNEYLAFACATGGKLLTSLQSSVPDERLLIGAGEILQALLSGRDCPAPQMADYADGAAATLTWLACVQRQRPRAPAIAASAITLTRIEANALPWEPATQHQIIALANDILDFDYWPVQVREQRRSARDRLPQALEPALAVRT